MDIEMCIKVPVASDGIGEVASDYPSCPKIELPYACGGG